MGDRLIVGLRGVGVFQGRDFQDSDGRISNPELGVNTGIGKFWGSRFSSSGIGGF